MERFVLYMALETEGGQGNAWCQSICLDQGYELIDRLLGHRAEVGEDRRGELPR